MHEPRRPAQPEKRQLGQRIALTSFQSRNAGHRRRPDYHDSQGGVLFRNHHRPEPRSRQARLPAFAHPYTSYPRSRCRVMAPRQFRHPKSVFIPRGSFRCCAADRSPARADAAGGDPRSRSGSAGFRRCRRDLGSGAVRRGLPVNEFGDAEQKVAVGLGGDRIDKAFVGPMPPSS